MPLQPEPNVPHTETEEVIGADGGKVVGALCSDCDAAILCVQDKTRAGMACVSLDLAGWRALRGMADDMAGRLSRGDSGGDSGAL